MHIKNYIIVDLEATCWKDRRDGSNEIIEIGAVLINQHQEILSEFEQFVQPIKHPVLSDFCTELTSITQQDVDQAPLFPEALERFHAWFNEVEGDYLLCSWGFYDQVQFINDCKLHGLPIHWLNNHISLKHQHRKVAGTRRALGMKNALKHEGFALDGTHHRGIDDARNIAKIFLKYFEQWNREESRRVY